LLQLSIFQPTAFFSAFLFALFPIHTEATTSVVGSAELLAAAFGLGALISFKRGHRVLALALFGLAVLSKESAAALAAIAWLTAGKPRRRFWLDGIGALAIIAVALVARALVARAPSFIPPIDNPMSLLPAGQRIVSALWVQCLYIWKTLVPMTLSADYSYKQIPLVMGLADIRAWCGIGLITAGILLARWKRDLLVPILAYAILFLPTANVLFPIGTMMGERLAYLPSAALALTVAIALTPFRRLALTLVAVVALVYGGRTVMHNLDWRNAETFYSRLVQTSPNSAKAHYFYGTLLASQGDDVDAIAEYDRAVAIFPGYSEAYHNRGNALARLGRKTEAMESYRAALRFDPGHRGAAENLWRLEAGLTVSPPRRRL
jgi:tetratricopeptide (TPR) repeat protein